jgi:hypothetical protein
MLKRLITFLKKPETIVILLSIGITSTISIVIGLSGYLLTNKFWSFFFIAFCIQFIIFAVVNTFLQRKDFVEGVALTNQQLEALSKFTIKLACAYCKQPNVTPITLNQENRFKCESCNQINSIKMQFLATQVTTPLTSLSIPTLDDEKIEFKVN